MSVGSRTGLVTGINVVLTSEMRGGGLMLNGEAGAMARKRVPFSRSAEERRARATAPLDGKVQTQAPIGPLALEPRVSIVIPAKNEARNLPRLFATLPTENCEVILVDGTSTDDTVSEALRLRPDITVIGQTRKGKGNALACGFAAATGDFIVMIDADGSNDPVEIPRFVDALKEGADFAKGSRFLDGGGSHDISLVQEIRELLAQQDRESALWDSVHRPLLWLQRIPARVS